MSTRQSVGVWTPFRADDESTWPQEKGDYIVSVRTVPGNPNTAPSVYFTWYGFISPSWRGVIAYCLPIPYKENEL